MRTSRAAKNIAADAAGANSGVPPITFAKDPKNGRTVDLTMKLACTPSSEQRGSAVA